MAACQRKRKCHLECRHGKMVREYQEERERQEIAAENGGPKASITFEKWLRHYCWEACS